MIFFNEYILNEYIFHHHTDRERQFELTADRNAVLTQKKKRLKHAEDDCFFHNVLIIVYI